MVRGPLVLLLGVRRVEDNIYKQLWLSPNLTQLTNH